MTISKFFGLAAIIAGLLGVAPPAATAGDTGLMAKIASGGRIYDNWYRELGEKKLRYVHPLYPEEGAYLEDPGQTWRCVACHGWDYKGNKGAFQTGPFYTGIKGTLGVQGKPEADIIAIITDEKHNYREYLEDEELGQLATFLSKGQFDMDVVVDPVTRRARIDALNSSAYFSTICTNCHGADGRKMDSIPPMGDISRSDPWQSLHKMLNGHPGDDMPALRAFDMRTVLGILAYIQALPTDDVLASVARGGKLYDDWIKEVNYNQALDPHPAYPDKTKKAGDGEQTWRCMSCHGWDYKGTTGVIGIREMAGAHPNRVMTVLRDDVHVMDEFLSYRDLADLANFVSAGQVEMNEFIDSRSKKSTGEGADGQEFFLTLCANCHGDKGKDIRTMPAIGRVANDDPWKSLHKILHGHPGEFMPAWQATMTPLAIKNILARLQELPIKKR